MEKPTGLSRGTMVIDWLSNLGLNDEAGLFEEEILVGYRNIFWYPCALSEDSEDKFLYQFCGTTVMLPPE
jgi:hypothetical protein